MPGFGIAFGTSFVRAAIALDKQAPALVEFDGARELPAVVAFEANGVAIGPDAIGARAADLVRGPKQLLGSERGVEAASLLARRVLDAAACAIGRRPQGAVIAMSSWLDAAGRRALADAHKRAGLRVQRVVSEASAAAAFLSTTEKSDRRIAIIDIGAGGASASILKISDRRVTWIACAGDPCAGGDAMDAALLAEALRSAPAEMARLPEVRETVRAACESMRRAFATCPSAKKAVRVDTARGPFALDIAFDARRFEALMQPPLDLIEQVCAKAMERAGVTRGQLDAVYATGGAAAMPEVRGAIASVAGEIARATLPFGPAAQGAALLSAAMQREADPVVVEDDPSLGDVCATAAVAPVRVSLAPSASSSASPPRSAPAPVSRPSVAPNASFPPEPRTSLIPALGDSRERVPNAGELGGPHSAAALMDLAIARALTPNDASPFALPVLLRRVLGRPDVSGLLTLTGDAERVFVNVSEGRAYLTDQENAALKRAFAWTRGTFAFEARAIAPGARRRTSMTPLAVAAIRVLAKRFEESELLAALGDAANQCPSVPPERHPLVGALGLEPPERRVVETLFDGRETCAKIVAHGGMPRTALSLLAVLKAFGMLEWRALSK